MLQRFESGEQLRIWTTGSGGHGSPLERDPEWVLEDVLNGRVSEHAAEKQYGVVISGDAVDTAATAELRHRMSRVGS